MEIESENHCVFVSFLDQVGTKEASCSVPSSPVTLETSSNSSIGGGASGGEMDLPAVRPTNITDLINESYEVSATTVSRLIAQLKTLFSNYADCDLRGHVIFSHRIRIQIYPLKGGN